MNAVAIARKRRKNKIITNGSYDFSFYIDNKDYNSAAKLVFLIVLKIGGKNGIMNALDSANSFIKRCSKREGDY